MSYLLIRSDNARAIPLADQSVHCICTSPPYWSLRDYGLPPSRWPAVSYRPMPGLPEVEVPAMTACLGLEPTPEAFVGHMVLVARELWRVLRDDGTLWLNFGDSYNASPRGNKEPGGGNLTNSNIGSPVELNRFLSAKGSDKTKTSGLKPKDLVGIPWRIAFALQGEGWYLRSDIIWAKPNPMPESVTDRPSKAHEYVFLLAKRPDYFYDAEAVKEPIAESSALRIVQDIEVQVGSHRANGGAKTNGAMKAVGDSSGRNKRTVWDCPTQPTSDAHFATWPERLVEPMILAGTSAKGCCPACGAPWVRVVEKDRTATRPGVDTKIEGFEAQEIGNRDPLRHVTETKTVGWESSCRCDAGKPVPAVVLDQFNGSGTTGQVARRHGRSYIGIDLNPTYLGEIAARRVERGERPHMPKRSKFRTPALPSLFGE